jgi:hypothetical protein
VKFSVRTLSLVNAQGKIQIYTVLPASDSLAAGKYKYFTHTKYNQNKMVPWSLSVVAELTVAMVIAD